MKQKLWKGRKPCPQFRVVLYSGEVNDGCTFDTNVSDCNTKIFCGLRDKKPTDGVNYRCNPPESTRDGAKNVRCNLAKFC
jgi:hypothetical protein